MQMTGASMIRPIPALLILCLSALVFYAFMVLVAHARWRPEFAQNSPEVRNWFQSQHNSRGQWCCSEADGHRFEGNYTPNPDGSVTVWDEGKKYEIDAYKVLNNPNPTGSAIWWFLDTVDGRTTYCFAPGSLS
jgi:hypothetical protein